MIRKIFNKVRFLKSDLEHKRSFLSFKQALIFTLAPYTHKGNEEKHHRIFKYLEPLFLDVFRSVPIKREFKRAYLMIARYGYCGGRVSRVRP